jgi:hypothetical protein
VASSCDHGNEPSGSIKGRIFLDQLSVLFSLSKITLLHGINHVYIRDGKIRPSRTKENCIFVDYCYYQYAFLQSIRYFPAEISEILGW